MLHMITQERLTYTLEGVLPQVRLISFHPTGGAASSPLYFFTSYLTENRGQTLIFPI